jgi:transcriptional regulator with XRE-family HTH domain
MVHKARHFLREWREAAELTLEQVAERVEILGNDRNASNPGDLTFPDTMTHVTLSRIENGKQPYKQQLLELLAEIYDTDPASLIMRTPEIARSQRDILDGLSDEQRELVMGVVRQFKPDVIEGGKVAAKKA